MKFVIGNWKSNKNRPEVVEWLDRFIANDLSVFEGKVEAVIVPPLPFILLVKERLKKYPWIKIGCQDISSFEAGAYTGAVSGYTLTDLVEYSIVGHSERRKYFKETDNDVESKIEIARNWNIKPILCVRGIRDNIPRTAEIVAYEPVDSISTGTGEGDAADVKSIVEMKKLLNLDADVAYIYGGSVNPSNAHEYLSHEEIDGVLPGGASLDPEKFYRMCTSGISQS